MLINPKYSHKVEMPPDDGGEITFQWHFQRGILEPRMSGYELAAFVLGHMPSITHLLGAHPRVQAEFRAMLTLLSTSPKEATNRLLPWIRSITREADDDVIHMSLYDKTEQPSERTFFLCH